MVRLEYGRKWDLGLDWNMGGTQIPRKSHLDTLDTLDNCTTIEQEDTFIFFLWLWDLRSLERIPLARRGRKIYLLFPKDSWSVDAPRVLVPMGPKELDNPWTTCQRDIVQSFTMFLCLLDYRGPSMNCRDQKTSCWRKRTSDDWAHDCISPFQEMKLVVGEISMQGSASSTK